MDHFAVQQNLTKQVKQLYSKKKKSPLNDSCETGFCSQVVSSLYFLHEALEESFLQVNSKKSCLLF